MYVSGTFQGRLPLTSHSTRCVRRLFGSVARLCFNLFFVADMASSVKLANHNDYIAPSQGCVVTLKGLKPSAKAFDDSQVRIHDKQSSHVAVSTDPVKVSLHDCLACSGCITTAETVMLEQQSTGVWCVGG